MENRTEHLLENKTALIIGGDGGIGFAIAEEFLKCGCKVLITGRNKKHLDNCKTKCPMLEIMSFSLNEYAKYKNIMNEAEQIAHSKINIVVNAAGVFDKNATDFLNTTIEEYDETMDINLKSNYFLCQIVGQYFIKHKIKGHILLVSSQSALEPSWSAYRLSKRGLSGLIEGVATQLIKYGVVVNGIGPGPTNTAMQNYKDGDSIYTESNPIRRYTTVEEVAQIAKILCSSQGDTIIGQTIYMSGGRGIIDKR